MIMKVLVACATTLMSMPAMAGGYASAITDTINLQVQGSAIQMERIGSSYSVSGSGLDSITRTAGTAGTATTAYVPAANSFTTTADQAFTFSEAITVGDSVGTAIAAPTAGVIASPANYGIYTTQFAGDNGGTLAGTLSATSIPTITAGGPGTTATAQRSVSLTVFD